MFAILDPEPMLMRVVQIGRVAAAMACVLVGCTKDNPAYCSADTDCRNGATCDLDAHACVIPDAMVDAPAKACGQTTCTNNELEVCGPNGFVSNTEPCALGCFADGTRCNAVTPSNGLVSYLDQAAQQSDVLIPDGATIDTDNGTVASSQGAVPVATVTVAQSGGPALRVLMAKSFTMAGVRVTGTLPLALVASGDIALRGVLDASADNASAGPGALACGTAGVGGAPGPAFFAGATNSGGYPTYLLNINGAGGGGFGTAGGTGGTRESGYAVGSGGAVNGPPSLVPLRGGCPGYAATAGYQGQGGGAVQIVAGHTVHLVDAGASKGVVHVGGGGGHAGDLGKNNINDTAVYYGPGGGGSGGGILIEAASVVLDDGTALLAAGGGGGGYGACNPIPNGLSAPANAGVPAGGACPGGTTPTASGGDGATTGNGANGANATAGSAGSGGGGLGRIRVNTADGQYIAGTSTIIRGVITTAVVGKH